MNATGESDMMNYYDYIDGLRETSFRGILERLLPIMALSAWGKIPDDMEVEFPPMATPDEKEAAETAEKITSSIVMAYQSDLIDRETASKELMNIDGVFDKVTDEMAEEGRGVTYTGSKMMNDPMMGLV